MCISLICIHKRVQRVVWTISFCFGSCQSSLHKLQLAKINSVTQVKKRKKNPLSFSAMLRRTLAIILYPVKLCQWFERSISVLGIEVNKEATWINEETGIGRLQFWSVYGLWWSVKHYYIESLPDSPVMCQRMYDLCKLLLKIFRHKHLRSDFQRNCTQIPLTEENESSEYSAPMEPAHWLIS